jgi:steroid 5-alpha reductase family enzyme
MIHEALIANAAILLGVTLILWVVAVQIDDVSFIDSFWGFGIALMAFTSWMQLEVPGPLATLLMGMAMIWGLRLSIYLVLRRRREGEDKRYERMLRKDREKGRFAFTALTKLFLGQAILLSSSAARRNTVFSKLRLRSRLAASRWSGWRFTCWASSSNGSAIGSCRASRPIRRMRAR